MLWKGGFNSLDEVGEKLALIEEFKSSSKKLIIKEYTVKKSFVTRKGVVGEQMEKTGKIYSGGATQIEFGAYKSKWDEYLGDSKIIKNLNF